MDYSAFGTVLGESSPSNGDRLMGFAGMERDTVTGLNLAVYRVQNPGTGRWTSQDPLGFAAGDANLYRYVGNGPTDAADPNRGGRWLECTSGFGGFHRRITVDLPGGGTISISLRPFNNLTALGPGFNGWNRREYIYKNR